MTNRDEFVFIRPINLNIEWPHFPKLAPAAHLYGGAYVQDGEHKNCTASLDFLPATPDLLCNLPRDAIGWGAWPLSPDGQFKFTIPYDVGQTDRLLSLRTVASAKDLLVKLFVSPLMERELAVLSLEMSEEYKISAQYRPNDQKPT